MPAEPNFQYIEKREKALKFTVKTNTKILTNQTKSTLLKIRVFKITPMRGCCCYCFYFLYYPVTNKILNVFAFI